MKISNLNYYHWLKIVTIIFLPTILTSCNFYLNYPYADGIYGLPEHQPNTVFSDEMNKYNELNNAFEEDSITYEAIDDTESEPTYQINIYDNGVNDFYWNNWNDPFWYNNWGWNRNRNRWSVGFGWNNWWGYNSFYDPYWGWNNGFYYGAPYYYNSRNFWGYNTNRYGNNRSLSKNFTKRNNTNNYNNKTKIYTKSNSNSATQKKSTYRRSSTSSYNRSTTTNRSSSTNSRPSYNSSSSSRSSSSKRSSSNSYRR